MWRGVVRKSAHGGGAWSGSLSMEEGRSQVVSHSDECLLAVDGYREKESQFSSEIC